MIHLQNETQLTAVFKLPAPPTDVAKTSQRTNFNMNGEGQRTANTPNSVF